MVWTLQCDTHKLPVPVLRRLELEVVQAVAGQGAAEPTLVTETDFKRYAKGRVRLRTCGRDFIIIIGYFILPRSSERSLRG